MFDALRSYVRSFYAAGAILSTVACAGGGSGTVAAPASFPVVPAAATVEAVAPQSLAVAAGSNADLDAEVRAALAAPANSDTEPVGDAAGVLDYGMTLTGNYHGLVNEWSNGLERFGGGELDLTRSGQSFSGTGYARSGSDEITLTVNGEIAAQNAHSLDLVMSAYGPNNCVVSGSVRRFRHVLEGVLSSPTCGSGSSPITYYFKLHPQ